MSSRVTLPARATVAARDMRDLAAVVVAVRPDVPVRAGVVARATVATRDVVAGRVAVLVALRADMFAGVVVRAVTVAAVPRDCTVGDVMAVRVVVVPSRVAIVVAPVSRVAAFVRCAVLPVAVAPDGRVWRAAPVFVPDVPDGVGVVPRRAAARAMSAASSACAPHITINARHALKSSLKPFIPLYICDVSKIKKTGARGKSR